MDATTVQVLGSCAAWPEAGRACTGFLVTAGDYRVVIDLGYGTMPRLMTAADAGGLARTAAVGQLVLTHFWPGNDRRRSRAAATAEFSGPITLADENAAGPLPLGHIAH